MISTYTNRAKQYAWSFLTQKMHLNWTLRSGQEVVIRNYADWCSFNEIFTNDEYTAPIQHTLAAGQPSLTVLDLGANVGYFTLKLLDLFLQQSQVQQLTVYLVEASPALCQELHRRIRVDSSRVQVHILNALVGKRSGRATLNLFKEGNQNAVAPASHDAADTDDTNIIGSQELDYIDLDQLTRAAGRIDLIKCDIEGSEFDFLDAFPDLLQRTDRLVAEFHPDSGSVPAALDRLTQLGFGHDFLRREGAFPVVYFQRPAARRND